jgi:hypothetical protein
MKKVKLTRREYRTEYLRSDEWKETRERVLKRENCTCQRCGKPARDVHHRKYDFISVKPDRVLMLLCRDCHDLAHKAIDAGVLPSNHSEGMLMAVNQEKVNKAKQKIVIEREMIESILAGTIHGIKLACGILKITEGRLRARPEGLKVSRDKYNHLRWIIRTKPTNRHRLTHNYK